MEFICRTIIVAFIATAVAVSVNWMPSR